MSYHPKPTDAQVQERFWSQVQRSPDCWLWTGGVRGRMGYGYFYKDGWLQAAHRLAWELTNGPIPVGLCVLHHCDVPRCVNPDHLFLGTRTDNARDRDQKGRARGGSHRGVQHPKVKLTEAQVREIRAKQGLYKQAVLAREYGVSQYCISAILTGKTWGHLQ